MKLEFNILLYNLISTENCFWIKIKNCTLFNWPVWRYILMTQYNWINSKSEIVIRILIKVPVHAQSAGGSELCDLHWRFLLERDILFHITLVENLRKCAKDELETE